MHGLDFGYWTARISIPLLTLGRLRVQSSPEQLSGELNGKSTVERGAASLFGAFLLAALVTGAAILATGGQF